MFLKYLDEFWVGRSRKQLWKWLFRGFRGLFPVNRKFLPNPGFFVRLREIFEDLCNSKQEAVRPLH